MSSKQRKNLQELAKTTITTGWCKATTNYQDAIAALMACRGSFPSCWLELRENGDQQFPITIVNPVLDDPFSWTYLYGAPTDMTKLKTYDFLNDTEKELMYHWMPEFGKPEIIEEYRTNGKIQPGLCMHSGTCFPIRIEDAQTYRDLYVKDGYRYVRPDKTLSKCMVYFWRPKDGIPKYVPDPNVGKVLTVCADPTKESISEIESVERTAKTLMKYAEYLKTGEEQKRV